MIIREFKPKSIIKRYHAYMNDWTPALGETLSARPGLKMKSINMPLAVTKDARVVGHLKKGKTGRYAKTAFYFL